MTLNYISDQLNIKTLYIKAIHFRMHLLKSLFSAI